MVQVLKGVLCWRIATSLLFLAWCCPAASSAGSPQDELGDFDVDIDLDGDVLNLNSSNINFAIEAKDALLIMFYAPWCTHSKKFTPVFQDAAATLNAKKSFEERAALGKIDGSENPSVAEKYGVTQFPTLKFFLEGKLHKKDITLHSSLAIVRFMHKKLNPPIIPIEKYSVLKSVKASPFIVVGYFDQRRDTDAFKTFVDVAVEDDYTEFFYAWERKIMRKANVTSTPGLVIYRHFDKREVHFKSDWGREAIENFIAMYKKPTVLNLNPDTTASIFDNPKPKVLLVNPDQGANSALSVFKKVAKKKEMKARYMFVTVGEDADPEFRSFMGSDEDKTDPEIYIYADDKENDVARKYYLDTPYTMHSIEKFVNDHAEGKLKEFKLSGPIRAGWDDSAVKDIARVQWEEFSKQSKIIVVEFSIPEECEQCAELKPKMDKCAERFEAEFPDEIVFARIDGSKNEIEGFEVPRYPSVYIIPFKKKARQSLATRGEPQLLDEDTLELTADNFCGEIRDITGLKADDVKVVTGNMPEDDDDDRDEL